MITQTNVPAPQPPPLAVPFDPLAKPEEAQGPERAEVEKLGLSELRAKRPLIVKAYEDAQTQRDPQALEELVLGGQEPDSEGMDRWVKTIESVENFTAHMEEGKDSQLRPYQAEAMRSFLEHLKRGEPRGYVIMPTGSGKTPLFSTFIQATNLTSLVLVPRLSLISQTNDRLGRFAQGVSTSFFYGKEKNLSGQAVICTYQSLPALLKEAESQGKKFGLVICDEAHRALTEAKQDDLDVLGKDALMLGFTATPDFDTEKSVRNCFGSAIYEMTLAEAIETGVIARPTPGIFKAKIQLDGVGINRSGDYIAEQLATRIDIAEVNEAVAKYLSRPFYQDKKIAVFCVNTVHADNVAQALTRAGLKAAAVHSKIDAEFEPGENDRRIAAYEEGEYQVLVSVDQLNEGWDSARTDVGINLRPTRSLVLASQRLGRVLRHYDPETHGDKIKRPLVIDLLPTGKQRGGRPISVTDVLAGVKLRKSVGEEEQPLPDGRRIKGEEEEKELGGEELGVEIVIGVEGVEEELDGIGHNLLTSLEDFRAVLAKRNADWFFEDSQRLLDEEGLQVEGAQNTLDGYQFVQLYYRRLRGKAGYARPSQEEARDCLVDLFGNELYQDFLNRQAVKKVGERQLQDFVRDWAIYGFEGMLGREYEVGEGEAKRQMDGQALWKGLTTTFIAMPKGQREGGVYLPSDASTDWLVERAFNGDPDGRRIYLRLLAGEGQVIHQLAESGRLMEALKSADPHLAWRTYGRFKEMDLILDGLPVYASSVLAYYRVESGAQFRELQREVLGGKDVEAVLREERGLIEAKVRANLDHYRTLPRQEFRQEVLLEGATPVTGADVLSRLEVPDIDHARYRELINQLAGQEKGFCRSFWPLDGLAVARIIKESLRAHGKERLANYDDLRALKLNSSWLPDPWPYSTPIPQTGGDLIAYWYGTRGNADGQIRMDRNYYLNVPSRDRRILDEFWNFVTDAVKK